MQPDIEEYRQYVDRFDISEEKKIELIHAVWLMMQSFVDTAFGYHPVQLSLKQDLQTIPGAIESENSQLYKSFAESAKGE